MRFEVTDDSGFLALIDPDAYAGFVGAEWDLGQLHERFTREMADRHLLIWGTGQEGCWTVEISLERSQLTGKREVRGSIVSTKGRLCLTNYESLTMAAQFNDVSLPERHQAGLVVKVAPGSYVCRVVQVSMDASGWDPAMLPEFLVELRPDQVLEPVWAAIPWTMDV